MNAKSNTTSRGDCLKPTATALLGKPLEFINEDHMRERQICTMLDEIAGAKTPSLESATDAFRFLSKELPLHLRDEEEDLFPLLQRRCAPEDEIDKVVSRLLSDHMHAAEDTPPVITILERLGHGAGELTARERESLKAFAKHSRRHLILENAIILPFARLRLTERDLETLCLGMCQRRGIDRLSDTARLN
ncbi:MAG: hemerythrin domain-containing protein [Paracoccaceae bacterium]